MKTCPKCGVSLTEEDLKLELCVECGADLTDKVSPGAKTVPDIDDESGDIAQTIDSVELPDSNKTVADSGGDGIAQTIDSIDIPPSSSPTVSDLPIRESEQSAEDLPDHKAKTVSDIGDVEIAQTIDSIDVPSEKSPTVAGKENENNAGPTVQDDWDDLPDHKAKTVADVPVDGIAQTIDSVDLPPHKANTVVDGPGEIAQTIDSVEGLPFQRDDDRSVQEGATLQDQLNDFERTIDSVAGSSIQHAKTVQDDGNDDDPSYSATMDSEVYSDSGQVSGYDATIDSEQYSSEADGPRSHSTLDSNIPREMRKLWGSSVVDARPEMTINTKGKQAVKSISSLTIQPREVGTSRKTTKAELDYDLESKIGQGGMGLVFSARQASLDRNVAIKMLRADVKKAAGQEKKFVSEAVVTGELEHPGIIPIYDMGCTKDGTLFYSMKQVHGTPWSKVIRKRSLIENIETLMRVCDAIAFAHSRDVIHRDLKPENIMLGEFGEVLVLDWGLAVTIAETPKSESIARITNMGGTPAYMAPEMATGPLNAIGKHSDIYLLGAILYECITGRLPRRSKTSMEALASAARNRIEPTRKKGELVDIARRAMATSPEDRYETVKAFQEAIRDYQSHSESISLAARAAEELRAAIDQDDYKVYAKALFGFEEAYELWPKNTAAKRGISRAKKKYAQSALGKEDFDLGLSLLDKDDPKHQELITQLQAGLDEREARLQRLKAARRVTVALAALVFLAVSVGSVLVWQAKQVAQANEIKARQNATRANEQADLAKKNRKIADDNAVAARKSATAAKKSAKEATEAAERAEKNRLEAVANEVKAVANEQKAEAERKKAVRERRKALYETYVALIGLAAVKIEERAFEQAISLLERCPEDQRNWEWGRLKFLCDLADGKPPLNMRTQVDNIGFDQKGDRIVSSGQDGQVIVWNVKTGKSIGQTRFPNAANAAVFSQAESDWVAVATAGRDGLYLWNYKTKEKKRIAGHTDDVLSIHFSPHNPRQLLTTSKDRSARLWDVASGKELKRFLGHSSWVWDAAFSPVDQYVIATASEDGTARVWDIRTGEQRLSKDGEPMPFRGHESAVFAIAFSPDGNRIATGGFGKRVLVWKPTELREFDFDSLLQGTEIAKQSYVAMTGHTAAVSSVAFSNDGKWVLSGSHDNTVRLWSTREQTVEGEVLNPGQVWKTLRGHSSLVRSVAFDPVNQNIVASGSQDGFVRFWDVKQYEEERFIPDIVLRGHTDAIFMADFAPNGEFVVTASRDRTARSWDQQTGESSTELREGHLFLVSSGIYYDDGRKLLTAAGDGSVRIWDVERATQLFTLERTGFLGAAALSRNGRWIVTGRDPRKDDGGNILAEDKGVVAAVWDGATGKLIRELRGHAAPVSAIAISPDGKTILTGDTKGRCNLWDLETGTMQRLQSEHIDKITAAVFTPDGKYLITSSDDTTVAQWDLSLDKPMPVKSLTLRHDFGIAALALSPDGNRVLTGDENGGLRLWNRSQAKVLWAWRRESDESTEEGDSSRQAITSVAISADGTLGLAVDNMGLSQTVVQWELDKPPIKPLLSKRFEARDVWSAIFTPISGEILVMGGDEATVVTTDGQASRAFSPHRTVLFASYSPDAKWIVTSAWDGTARIWDRETGEAIRKLEVAKLIKPEGNTTLRVESAVFSRDGKMVLTACNTGQLVLWNALNGKHLRTLDFGGKGLNYATFSPSSDFIIGAYRDGMVKIWDTAMGKILREMKAHQGPVLHAAFSSDDTRIVTSGEDRMARVWDVKSKELLFVLEGHTDAVTCAAFSPDGKRVLTGSRDQTAKLWDTADSEFDDVPDSDTVLDAGKGKAAKEILTLRGHHQLAVTSVAFSADGRKALTSSLDGTAVIWPAKKW